MIVILINIFLYFNILAVNVIKKIIFSNNERYFSEINE